MEIVKWVILIGLIGLAAYLTIDTVIHIVKVTKKRRLAKKAHENLVDNNDKQ